MIEKIKGPLDLKVCNYKGTEFDIIPADTFAMVCRKINEIIELLNAIVVDVDGIKCVDGSKKPEPVHQYEEQREYLCKLCWFWNDNKADKVIGILTGVFDEAERPFERNIDQTLYKHCEPVKPDSELIYHGE